MKNWNLFFAGTSLALFTFALVDFCFIITNQPLAIHTDLYGKEITLSLAISYFINTTLPLVLSGSLFLFLADICEFFESPKESVNVTESE